MAWDRLEVAFMLVAPVARCRDPLSNSAAISAWLVTAASATPARMIPPWHQCAPSGLGGSCPSSFVKRSGCRLGLSGILLHTVCSWSLLVSAGRLLGNQLHHSAASIHEARG